MGLAAKMAQAQANQQQQQPQQQQQGSFAPPGYPSGGGHAPPPGAPGLDSKQQAYYPPPGAPPQSGGSGYPQQQQYQQQQPQQQYQQQQQPQQSTFDPRQIESVLQQAVADQSLSGFYPPGSLGPIAQRVADSGALDTVMRLYKLEKENAINIVRPLLWQGGAESELDRLRSLTDR